MKIPVREGVELSQVADMHDLKWLSNKEAATLDGRPENRDYIDFRQCDLDELKPYSV